MAYRRLFNKLTKENLWLYLLRMLINRPMYAYEIAKKIKIVFGFDIAIVTVYVVLYKMRREGLIQTGETEPIPRKLNRKYYEITEKGLNVLKYFRELQIMIPLSDDNKTKISVIF